ncbi:MAG: cytochrome c family protein [Proteobacteria bacterium]|nr:cytochrome c family protein [Pseudomonadota bacterium]
MDSLAVNKGVAAVLTAGIAFFLTGLIGDHLVRNEVPEKAVIAIETPQGGGGGGAAPAAPAGPDNIDGLIATADVGAGEAYVKKVCAACHTFTQGGPAGVGPNLYGVLGAPHGHMEGYAYSAALKGIKGPWTYEALNKWLYKPAAYAPGTKMGFAGIPSDKERANVIAYLRTLSPNPEALPPAGPVVPAAAPAAAPAAGGATPAAGGAPAAAAGPELPPIAPLLAKADPAKGEAFTKTICVACHTFTKGGPNGVGPNLYDVVGRKLGEYPPNYTFSAGMKAKGGNWTFTQLNEWLDNPMAFVKGTRMIYPGIKDAQMRANVIDYLRTLSPNPIPLPKDEAEAAATPEPK